MFAFLGLNGAGKSTTINIICGDYKKDSGTVMVDNKNIDTEMDKIKSLIGVVYQDSVLDKQLSVSDNLECRASLYDIYGEEYKKLKDSIDYNVYFFSRKVNVLTMYLIMLVVIALLIGIYILINFIKIHKNKQKTIKIAVKTAK